MTEAQTDTPRGYWKDAKGSLVPVTKIKDNTDIDMLSGEMPVVRVMEQRLLETVLSSRTPMSR